MQPRNNWNVEYPHIRFLEQALTTHRKVKAFKRDRDILFTVERQDALPEVIAVLVNRYTISLADVMAAKQEFPSMTCIVATGNWCGYTRQAKEHGLKSKIGVFNASEFLGALWLKNVANYAQKDADGKRRYQYRST